LKLWAYIVFIIYLLVLSIIDIKNRELSLGAITMGIIFAPVFYLLKDDASVFANLLGLIPGSILLLLSYITRGQIGPADALLTIVIGATVGIADCIVIVGSALFLVAPVSGVMLVCKRFDRKSRLPFVPFLFAGAVFVLLLAIL